MDNTPQDIKTYSKRIRELRSKIKEYSGETNVSSILKFLNKKRMEEKSDIDIVPIKALSDWIYSEEEGVLKHKKGTDHFFSVVGMIVRNSKGSEVSGWNQPILAQKAGGYLVILCQQREGTIMFLLQTKFEGGNINKIQFGPTIQATTSNLSQHHGGKKPALSEYIDHPKSTIVYTAKHNEEGSRFWQKSNVNRLVLLDPDEEIPLNGNHIWLTLPQIKKLMLYDNIVNPFVKTILSPL